MKRGMKSVWARERPRSLCGAQIRKEGKEQRCRPNRSPRLNRRMLVEVKRSGGMSGLTGLIAVVMGGKTDYDMQAAYQQKVRQIHKT